MELTNAVEASVSAKIGLVLEIQSSLKMLYRISPEY